MPDSPDEPSGWLLNQWVVAGIVSAAARFIPIPFVDDLVQTQCRRFIVSRTLSSHPNAAANATIADLKPYYSDRGGCVNGCVGTIAKAPLKLLLFPIRKIVSMVTSIRDVPLEIMRSVLLGRTLYRHLTSGKIDSAKAARMKAAFDEAFDGMDFRTVRAAITDAIESVSDWKTSAIQSARKVADRSRGGDRDIEIDASVETTASRVTEVLDRPETTQLFAEFDQRFDIAMRSVQA